MAQRFCSSGSQNAQVQTSVLAYNNATGILRAHVYDLIVGCSSIPADYVIGWRVRRSTAPGDGTPFRPQKLDSAGGTASISVQEDFASEPTYTAGVLMSIPQNVQATFRWTAPPGEAFVIPAVVDAGLGIQLWHVSAGSSLIDACAFHEE